MRTAVKTAVNLNPFASDQLAAANSAYGWWRDNKYVRVSEPQRGFLSLAECAHGRFRALVSNPQFSCIGAKAALSGNCYRFGFYAEMNSAAATAGLAHDLWTYAHEQKTFHTDYATFVVSFSAPDIENEKQWEQLLWAQLQSLHALDASQGYGWDKTVSSNPSDASFSFSFAETAFFIVGLNPASSRTARQFPYPTLVFNAHAQFERLREQNKFDRMRATIRQRDLKLQGSLNPNLSNYGESSEARQYSGRAVEENWQCPFQARTTGAEDLPIKA